MAFHLWNPIIPSGNLAARCLVFEEREIGADGSTDVGIFLPIPYNLARLFPKKPEDSSVPHFTILLAGNYSSSDFQRLVLITRTIGLLVRPFTADLSEYGEFENHE